MTNHALGIWTCTQVAWQFRVTSPRRCICKIPWQTEFQCWIVNFQAEVCTKPKILALVLQWNKRSKQPARWRTSSIQNQLRWKILWFWRIGFDDGGRIWNGAAILYIWSTSVERWQDKRAKNSYTERKTEEWDQRKTIGSCSRRDACNFLHTHATGDSEDNVEWSGETQEILT